jgi:phospholipid/cholesterol/gamma-HCH transport system substrate-binding protein
MRRETKIGLLALVSISLLIWGYQFLKGKNILSPSQIFYVEYEHVEQLQPSNPILINGFQVGIVKDIYLKPEDSNILIVELDVEKGMNIPKDAVAEIMTTSMMGGRAVVLKFDNPCSTKNGTCAQNGDYLQGRTTGFLNSMVGTDNVQDYVEILQEGIQKILDTLSSQADEGGALQKTIDETRSMISNLNSITGRVDRELANSTGAISSTLGSAASFSKTLEESNEQIKTILTNAKDLTQQLSDADLKKVVDNVDGTITDLQSTLSTVDKAVGSLNTSLDKLKTEDNTLGALLNDKELYNNLNVSLTNLELLLQDIRLHPERYRRILSKKKMEYEKPENDPGLESN